MPSQSRTDGPSPGSPEARFLEAVQYILNRGYAPSERQLALDLGLPSMILYKVRRGLQRYPQHALERLEALYGISADYVSSGKGKLVKAPPSLPGHRLVQYLDQAGMSEKSFLQAIRLSRPEAQRLLLPTHQPTTAQLRALSALFPTLNIAWLVNGAGEPQLPQPKTPGPAGAWSGALEPTPGHQVRLAPVPLIDFRARATFTGDELRGTPREQLEKVAVPIIGQGMPPRPERLSMISLEGESMAPTLAPGEHLLVEQIQQADWPYLSAGVYLIEYSESAVVKRVRHNELLTRGVLTLHSDNTDYGSIEVPADELRAIGRVLQAIRAI